MEGVFDVMKMWEFGFKNCAAVLGAELSNEQSSFLLQNGVQTITIYADGDKGGINFIEKAISKNKFFDINIMPCKWGKDPSEMSKKETEKAYLNKVNSKSLKKEKRNEIDYLDDELLELNRRVKKNKSYFY